MSELKLMGMLRRRKPSDVAVELECTLEELHAALVEHGISPDPEPAPLPDHTRWRPEEDVSYPRFIDQGVRPEIAAAKIELTVRWACREGTMHIDAAGDLIRDWNPELLAKPWEWRAA